MQISELRGGLQGGKWRRKADFAILHAHICFIDRLFVLLRQQKQNTMKRRYTLWMAVGLMMTVLSACTNRETMDKLEFLETRMAANADSVREALAAMDGSRLHGEARALHALLYSQALDKCYIDVTNDSLIAIAAQYYEHHKNPNRRLMSLYYHGRVHENAHNNRAAIICYTKATESVDKVSDPYIKGLLYAHLGKIQSQDEDNIHALDNLKKACAYYEQANRTRMQYNTIRNIGSIYLALGDTLNAEQELKRVLGWAYKHRDRKLCKTTIDRLLYLYYIQGDSASFREVYRDSAYGLCDEDLNSDIYIANYYAMAQDEKQSRNHLSRAWEKAQTASDSIRNYQIAAFINQRFGDYEEALNNHIKLLHLQNRELRQALQRPILATLSDFYHDQNELIEIKLQKSRQAIFFICVVGVLTIALTIIVSRTRARKKREELEDYMSLNEELKRSIYSKEETISTMGKRLAHLLRGRYELLNELTNTYYETNESIAAKEKVREVKGNAEKMNGRKTDEKKTEKTEDSKESREAIYKKVKTAIDRMAGNRKEMQELESIVNDCCNNVMQYLHEELPELPYDDTVLLCYIYAGFSAKAIHMFTKNSVSNIYSRKSRLRDHIRQSGAPHSQLLLDMMP